MTWTITNPPDIVRYKSKEVIQAYVLAANSALAKGLTEEEAVFAGLGAAKRLEQSQVTKQVKPKVPSHVQALLNRTVQQANEPENKAQINRAFLGKSALPSDQERTLVSADFNSKNQLVLLFDTGEQLITKAIDIDQSIQQYLSVSAGLSNPVNYIEFDQTLGTVAETGQLTWNETDGTLDLGLKGGFVTLQIGQEQHVRILNTTGGTFVSPNVVRISGAQGNRLTAELSIASNAVFADNTFAVVTETILNNQQGFATTSGLVRDVDTSAFTEGADLYLSSVTAGAITSTPPVAPARIIRVGYCVRSHPVNGSIFVATLEHPDIVELGSTLITSPQNNEVLMYESATGLWKNKPTTSSVLSTSLVSTAYTVVPTDYTIRVDCSSASVVISLPPVNTSVGRIVVIKKIDSSVNTVDITASAAELIDGVNVAKIQVQYLSLTLQSNGSSWDII